MANVKSVQENQVVIIKVTQDEEDYEVHFSFPNDNVKSAQISVYLGGHLLSTAPATVVQSAIQAFAETRVEFAS